MLEADPFLPERAISRAPGLDPVGLPGEAPRGLRTERGGASLASYTPLLKIGILEVDGP